ncbi:MAG: hypothetical protein CVV24_07340 [Ignavibacteriae bacterium HGW-Ignavibacteriae-3]|nr:MAG: hypothetical protein CVV24_07340 [Ignavibacteriae bacterium HGW-Ignavibacteriae-3]
MPHNIEENFPRELTPREKNWIFAALPENKLGYKQYRDIIENLLVIGYGRFGEGNLILGEKGDTIDLEVSSTPILAVATITFDVGKIYITIHEELENQIEVDIKGTGMDKIPDDLREAKVWTYSNWVPGEKAPFDKSDIREVHLVENQIVLAIAPVHKKVWVYNYLSGINHFIPVTNYYNEMMILMNNKNSETALNPGRLFSNLSEFTDEQLVQGFLVYNKYWQRVKL